MWQRIARWRETCLKPIGLPSNASFTTEAGTNLPSSSYSFNPTAFQWDSLQQRNTHTQTWQQGSGLVSNKPCYLHVGVQMWISLMFDFPKKKRWLEYLTSPHHPIFVRHIQIYNMPELPGNFANPFHSKGWRRIGFRPLLPRCEHVWGTQFTRLQQVTTANSRGLDCWLAKVLSSFIIKFHLSSFRSNISRRKLA